MGVPLEQSKLEGPPACLKFLGIEVDTMTLQIRLPSEKLHHLKEQLAAAVSKRCMSKRNLQSLTGLLQHATKVVQPGRPFLHRLYGLQNIGSLPTHHIRLNQAARSDITWWFLFVERWNGLSIAWDLRQCSSDITVYPDASGSWGCGAYSASHWFQLKWPAQVEHLSIATKELFPVVISAALFGKLWSGHLVEFKVDNLAVVQVIQATYCKDSHLMHLIRLLVFFAAHFNFWFSACHIAGRMNTGADALSRNNHALFLSQVSEAAQKPVEVRTPSTHKSADPDHHMDMHSLDRAVQHYFTAALAQSSHKTYQAAAKNILLSVKASTHHPFQPQEPYCAISQPVWVSRVWLNLLFVLTFQE